MAIDIQISDLTDGSLNLQNEWIGNGVFDKLIAAVAKNIEIEYLKGRITGTDYADVYLRAMQQVINESMQFVLQEKQTEAQVALLEQQTLLAQQQVEAATAEAEKAKMLVLAEIQKQWGFDVTDNGDGTFTLGSSTGEGKIDADIKITNRKII